MRHRSKRKKSRYNIHVIDNIWIIMGVVLVWRGLWNILDEYLFSFDPILASFACIVVGGIMLYFPDGDIEEL